MSVERRTLPPNRARTADEVGPWTEVKVEIVREYAAVFQKIINAQKYFHPVYMDGFSGSGVLVSEATGEQVAGTPKRIVDVQPPFEEYHFIEKDQAKANLLRSVVGDLPTVKVHTGDSNEILLNTILPTMTYSSYRKGLLFLDPYGLDLDWRVVHAAGQSRCVDLLLNFPIMDMNRTVLWRQPERVAPAQVARMNRYFGDERAWRDAAYEEPRGLFGPMPLQKKPGNEPIVQAYTGRLEQVAAFAHVSTALPMTNDAGVAVYYLIGASQARQAVGVFNSVFKKWRKRGVRIGSAERHRVD